MNNPLSHFGQCFRSPHSLLQPVTLLKVTLLHKCFSRFLDCTNCTKPCKATCEYLNLTLYCLQISEIQQSVVNQSARRVVFKSYLKGPVLGTYQEDMATLLLTTSTAKC